MHFHCHWINFPIYQKVQNFTAVFQREPFCKKVSPNAVDPIRIACAHVMLRFVIRNFLTADVINRWFQFVPILKNTVDERHTRTSLRQNVFTKSHLRYMCCGNGKTSNEFLIGTKGRVPVITWSFLVSRERSIANHDVHDLPILLSHNVWRSVHLSEPSLGHVIWQSISVKSSKTLLNWLSRWAPLDLLYSCCHPSLRKSENEVMINFKSKYFTEKTLRMLSTRPCIIESSMKSDGSSGEDSATHDTFISRRIILHFNKINRTQSLYIELHLLKLCQTVMLRLVMIYFKSASVILVWYLLSARRENDTLIIVKMIRYWVILSNKQTHTYDVFFI